MSFKTQAPRKFSGLPTVSQVGLFIFLTFSLREHHGRRPVFPVITLLSRYFLTFEITLTGSRLLETNASL